MADLKLRLAAACALLALALSACAGQSAASSGPDPTAFLATRVVEVLTQNAATDVARAAPGETAPPDPSGSATPLRDVPLPTAGATVTPGPSPEDSPTPATPCADQACASTAEHLWLGRPVPAGYADYPDRTYPYGSTLEGLRVPHHGVEFANPRGTPVIAAAPGTVVVAGDDHQVAYGPATYFYGNLVVVRLDQAYQGRPVFNLYAHLEAVTVSVGQAVQAGDMLGTVGQTGVAIGPHLHFEVRVGQNDYYSTRNPELWLRPLLYDGRPGGVIAGRVVDTSGAALVGYPVTIRPLVVDHDTPRSRYITTYALDPYALNGDDVLQENFALSDLPPGTYSVSVNTTTLYAQTVSVTSGRLTWVTFVVKPPLPTETPRP